MPINGKLEVNEMLEFSDTTTLDANTLPKYLWDFGDGTTSTEVKPRKAYATTGSKTVTLTITDQWGRASSAQQVIEILPPVPVADFTFASGKSQGESVQFTDASTKDASLTLTYAWDFQSDAVNDSTLQNPAHTYSAAGTYSAKLTVTDQHSRSSTVTKSVYIMPPPPSASFTITDDGTPETGENFQMTDTSTGTGLSWAWDFGDTTTSTLQNPAKSYATAGTYTIALTITDSEGRTSTASVAKEVWGAKPVASFTLSAGPYYINQNITATDTSTGSTTLTYAWDVENDGVTDATTQNHTWAYTTAGDKTVKLTVTDTKGRTSSATQTISVAASDPLVADFSTSDSPTARQAVSFTPTVSGGTAPYSYAWDFTNDGTNDSTVQNPSHTYPLHGSYTVKLVVTDSAATPVSVTVTKTVTVAAPEAIRQTAKGLYYYDDFNRPDGPLHGRWTTLWGAPVVRKGRAEGDTGSSGAVVPIGFLGEWVMQGLLRVATNNTHSGFLRGHIDLAPTGSVDGDGTYAVFLEVVSGTFYLRLQRKNADGTFTMLGSTSVTAAFDTDYSCRFHFKAGTLKAYFNGSLIHDVADTTYSTQQPLISLGAGQGVGEVAVFKTSFVKVTGLPTGFKIRMGAGAVATEVSGTATLELGGGYQPWPHLEVLNADNGREAILSPLDGIWGGDEFDYYHNPPKDGTGKLSRSRSGVFFRDTFGTLGRAWSPQYGAENWSLVGGELRNKPVNSGEWTLNTQVAERGETVVQVWHRATTDSLYPGLQARVSSDGNNLYQLQVVAGTDKAEMWKKVAGTWTFLGDGVVACDNVTGYAMKLHVKNGQQRGWVNGTLGFTATDTALDGAVGRPALRVGMGAAGTSYFDSFVACASNSLVCSGLPAGGKLRCAGLVATESAGTATLDMAGTHFPVGKVEVLDSADVVLGSLTPDDGTWGGDVFNYSAGTVTRSSTGLLVDNRMSVVDLHGWGRSGADQIWEAQGEAVLAPSATNSYIPFHRDLAIPYGIVWQSTFRKTGTGARALMRIERAAGTYDEFTIMEGTGGFNYGDQAAANRLTSAYTSDTNHHTFKAQYGNNYQKGWMDGTLKLNGTVATNVDKAFNRHIVWMLTTTAGHRLHLDNYGIFLSNTVTCSGLPTGYKIRAGGLTATESAGTATIDAGGLSFPFSALEVLDGTDVVVATLNTGIYGGDRFTYTA